MRLLLLLLLGALAPLAPLSAQTIQGLLLDAQTDEPVVAGTVLLIQGDSTVVARAHTDSTGAFGLSAARRGAYRVRAARQGYRTATSPPLQLRAMDTLQVEFRLAVDAVLLEPVVVTARKRRLNAAIQGFYDRAQARSFGSFFTREQIEQLHPIRTTDLLRRIPGIQLKTIMGGNEVVMRGTCRPTAWVDGIRIGFYRSIDDLAQPGELEGVEVYRSVSEAPVQFTGLRAGCGAVLLWTRRGP